jgi:hypothetical protein
MLEGAPEQQASEWLVYRKERAAAAGVGLARVKEG